MVLVKEFGHQWTLWDRETLRTEIIKTFRATSVSDHNWSKIQAIRTLVTSIGAWKEWHVFEKVVISLNNVVPDFGMAQRCSLCQLTAGVDIISQVRKEEYNLEVCGYVASSALAEGVTYLPDPLDFAQACLEEPQYECLDCGNMDDDDLDDERCDACVDRYGDDHPFNGKPAENVPDEVGRNLRKFKKRDPAAVKKAYSKFRGKEEADVDPDNPEEVQAAKLAVAENYRRLRRGQLVDQLKALKTWVASP
jgi:mRNA-degrading endonuclease RelE of RelBE toxin-antitoxin system